MEQELHKATFKAIVWVKPTVRAAGLGKFDAPLEVR